MEWTQSGVVLPRFFQRHTAPYHIDDVETVNQIVDKTLWYPAGQSLEVIFNCDQVSTLLPPWDWD